VELQVEVLTHALEDEEPLVREHAAWALERLRK
jgi:HEAT repeat protein